MLLVEPLDDMIVFWLARLSRPSANCMLPREYSPPRPHAAAAARLTSRLLGRIDDFRQSRKMAADVVVVVLPQIERNFLAEFEFLDCPCEIDR